IQEGKIVLRLGPAQWKARSQRIEIDHRQDRLLALIDPDQDVAGMKILVDEAGIMEPRRQGGEHLREPVPDSRLARFGPSRQALLDEFVERPGIGDRRGDQIILEQEESLPLLAQRDRRDRRHSDRREMAGAPALISPFATAEPLADLGAEAGDQEMFDEDRTLRQIDAIDDAMRAGL